MFFSKLLFHYYNVKNELDTLDCLKLFLSQHEYPDSSRVSFCDEDITMEEIECLLRRSQVQCQEQIVPDADAISGIGFGSQEPKAPPKESTTHIIRRGKGKGKGQKLFSIHKSSYNDARRDDDDVLVSTGGP